MTVYKNPKIHWAHGKIQGRTALVSCDSQYFKDHFPAYLYSANQVGINVHVHVINPTPEARGFLGKIRDAKLNINLTASYEEDGPRERVYYACNRFIVASILLNQTFVEELFITDVDALWMKTPESPQENIGLFTREPLPGTVGWEAEGTRIAAGIVFVRNTQDARTYLNFVSEYIMYEKTPAWFLDQVALNTSKRYIKEYHTFDSSFMDWEFREGTVMWTGKGERKHTNPIYIAKKKEYHDQFVKDL